MWWLQGVWGVAEMGCPFIIAAAPFGRKNTEARLERFQTFALFVSNILSSMPTLAVTDRRIAKTRLALRDAMLFLLPERGWDALTIQEICDQADVGRSTFYGHYSSKDALLIESLNDLREMLDATVADSAVPRQPLACLTGLLAHVVEHRRVFASVVGRRSGHGIERRFRDMVFQLIERDLLRWHPPGLQHQMLARYIAGGVVDLMAWWVEAPDAVAVEEVDQFAQALVRTALQSP